MLPNGSANSSEQKLYLWQPASVHLLPAPVQVTHVAARQDTLQGALQRLAVLRKLQRPVEDVRTGSACQQQVQQSLQIYRLPEQNLSSRLLCRSSNRIHCTWDR